MRVAGGGGGGEAGAAGAGAAGAASSLACGARSIGASPDSSGPSRYGFGSPCSAAGRVVRGPRPRRGGRRRSVMQVLSVRVNARGHAYACSRKSRCERFDRVIAKGTLSRGNATRHAPQADRSMFGNRATRLVLCLDRLPARIPHAGSGNGPTRGRGTWSRLVYPCHRGHWSGRASMLGRSTRSAVVPTDATSMANYFDSRNPPPWAANFVPAPSACIRE